MKRRTGEALDLQSVETDCRANHVDDGIERTDLVKVNVIDRLVMNTRFSFGKSREDLHRTLLHSVRQCRTVDNLFNIRERSVAVLVCRLNARVRRTQTRAINCLEVDAEPGNRKQRELPAQEVWIHARSDHRAEYHVAARAGKTVEVKSLHFPTTATSRCFSHGSR